MRETYSSGKADVFAVVHGSHLSRHIAGGRVHAIRVYVWTRVDEYGQNRVQEHRVRQDVEGLGVYLGRECRRLLVVPKDYTLVHLLTHKLIDPVDHKAEH